MGKRPDGYHELRTVFQTIALADKLTFDWGASSFRLVSDHPDLPADESNLILKAVRAIEKQLGSKIRVSIQLEKKIPMGAGLGGGSSNAATVLLELGKRFSLAKDVLASRAAELGADVPFFLTGGTAFARGKGEILELLPSLPPLPLIVVKPSFSISTSLAYSKIKRYSTGEKTEKLVNILRTGLVNTNCHSEPIRFAQGKLREESVFDGLFDLLTNDFEDALFPIHPELSEIKQRFLRAGALAALMTGSGSALFAFARDPNHAATLARGVESLGQTWITQTL